MQTRAYGPVYEKIHISDACYLPSIWIFCQVIGVFEIPSSQTPQYKDGDSKKWYVNELPAQQVTTDSFQ